MTVFYPLESSLGQRMASPASKDGQSGVDESSGSPKRRSSKVENFMSKFRDKDTRALKNLNSSQFIEVWNNYDRDGKFISLGRGTAR